eukprot:CAMPEP_0203863810 /NCGR_PEP_ID=MMETSP0359-20131031/14391_1 /ASSEMBLY_ACC=CAM_ASM_000338 /TAXON_ID=268821 /ORGANISM="Scrippsiella Hangoei, Strain SHTV-5" /LENGTH=145 /DNA_ID=CAMNT_0050781427 /DNA_START=117 /DNA_END=554 /DNA_ORIENTATION=+
MSTLFEHLSKQGQRLQRVRIPCHEVLERGQALEVDLDFVLPSLGIHPAVKAYEARHRLQHLELERPTHLVGPLGRRLVEDPEAGDPAEDRAGVGDERRPACIRKCARQRAHCAEQRGAASVPHPEAPPQSEHGCHRQRHRSTDKM